MAMEPGRPRARGERCPRCGGTGKVTVTANGRTGLTRCPACKGERFKGPPVWTK